MFKKIYSLYSAFCTQPAFYSQSVVCILHSVCSLPLVCSLQSAVCVLHWPVIYIRSFSSFCTSSSSNLTDWEFTNWFCFFSHDLTFENGSVISLTNEAIQLQHKHCNGFSILIGCSYCITVASSLFISFFQHIITSQILHFGPQNASQCPKEW